MLGGMLPYLAMAQLLATRTHGENPAIKVIFTDKGLQYAKEMGAKWLLDNIGSVSLPDVSGKFSLGFLGDVDYSLIGMRVTQFDFPEPTVNFYEDISGFKAYISGVQVAVSGLWSTSYGLIGDDGDFDLEVLDLEVEAFLSVGMAAGGQPAVWCTACGAAVGSASIYFYGGGSWIFQPFVNYYTERIRSIIEETICPELLQSLDRLQYQLLAMSATFQVNQLLAMDVPLTSIPVISSSSLSLSLKGLFHILESQETPPFEAQPFWLAEEPGHMLSLGLSQYTVNSAAYAYFSSGELYGLITDDMIPPGSPFHLNTNSLGRFVPQLSKMYPDMEMKLQVYASEAPEVHFKPGAVKTNLLGAVKAFAIHADGTPIPLFKLNVESTFTGKFHMATGKLMGSVAMDNFTLTLAASEVGPFKTSALETIIKLGIKLAGLSTVNAKLAKGIDLPTMQHIQLTNLVLKVEEGFISVLSDANIWLMGDSYDGTPWIF